MSGLRGEKERITKSDINSDTDFVGFAGKNLDQIFGSLSDLLQGAGGWPLRNKTLRGQWAELKPRGEPRGEPAGRELGVE